MRRREFLERSFGTMGAAWLAGSLPWNALAHAPAEDRFFVSLHIENGWDITLATDPWLASTKPANEDMFIEYDPSQVIRPAGLPLGPSGAPLAPFADRITIINGVLAGLTDNGHEAHATYMKTGSGSGSRPEVTLHLAEAASHTSFGVLSADGRPFRASSRQLITSISSIASLLEDGRGGGDGLDIEGPSSPLEKAKRRIAGSTEELAALRTRIIETEKYMREAGALVGTLATFQPTIGACFLNGMSRQACLRMSANLDTHGAHEGNHRVTLGTALTDVANMFRAFRAVPYGNTGESLFDRTTFMITSEFSRTAALNASLGKDHNPLTNSVILAGRGIRGGTVCGASKLITRAQSPTTLSYHIAQGFDFDSQRPVENRNEKTSVLLPENVIVTIEKLMGVPRSWSTLQYRGFRGLDSILT